MPDIVRTEGVLGGDPRTEDSRIGVYHVYERYVVADDSPEAIATSLDISVADVHAALAYAFSNPDEMREIEDRNQELTEGDSTNNLVPDDVD